VERLIAARTQARKSRDFDLADAIRDELLQDHSVGVFDKDYSWRTGCSAAGSGMRGGDFGRGGDSRNGRESPRGQRRNNFGPNGHDYELSFDAGPNQSDLSDEEIHEKLAERLQAKMSRRFDVADRIQQELLEAGVSVYDKKKEWRADGVFIEGPEGADASPRRGRGDGRRDNFREYQQSSFSEDVDDEESIGAISKLVAERSKCKATRQFDSADRIRDQLIDDYDVMVDDRLQEWSKGGNFGKNC
jgi:cysteinyl-tRNA synthetase